MSFPVEEIGLAIHSLPSPVYRAEDFGVGHFLSRPRHICVDHVSDPAAPKRDANVSLRGA